MPRKIGKTILSLVLIFGLFFSLVPLTHAETDVVKELTDFGKSTAGIKNIKDINGTDVGNKIVKDFVGDIPTQTMKTLIEQAQKEFDLYTTKNDTTQVRQCERAANTKAWSIFLDARGKAHFAPWVDIAWSAVKATAGGGKTISELVASHTKSKVSALLKDRFNKGAPLPKETVRLSHGGSCNTKSVIVRDPQNKLFTIDITGDCGCIDTKTGTVGSIGLNSFKVHIQAPVTVSSVEIKQKKRRQIFSKDKIQVTYKLGDLTVDTEAECQRFCPTDPPPKKEKKGWIAGIIDRLFGSKDDQTIEPEDGVDEQENETEDETDKNEEQTDESDDEEEEDDQEDEEDTTEDNVDSEGKDDEIEEEDDDEEEPIACGDRISIDDRSRVRTYEYRGNDGEITQCDGACKSNQICKIVPSTVAAFRDSCSYCHDLCEKDQFVSQYDCEQSISDKQECVPVGENECYGVQDKKEKNSSLEACEKAVRTLLDVYLGRFDPPLAVNPGEIVFTVPEYRCFSDEDFQIHHRGLVDEGMEDSSIVDQCPTLQHISSEKIHLGGEGKGATCETKTIFRF